MNAPKNAFKPSRSERNGIKALCPSAKAILSIGISTAGSAEINFARKCPAASVIATTIDEKGIAFTKEKIKQSPFARQIECRLEDCSRPLPYANNMFDYVYSRLCLQYLNRHQFDMAMSEISRVLKSGHKLYIAVRSEDDTILKLQHPFYEPDTGMTSFVPWLYLDKPEKIVEHKQFFTETSLKEKLEAHGFEPQYIQSFQEILYADYERTRKVSCPNSIIESVAVKKDSASGSK